MRIELDWPMIAARDDADELIAEERRVGAELIDEGVLRRIWRVPGRYANIGVWEAPDATVLDANLARLPLRRWLVADVMPLAAHELEEFAARAANRVGRTTVGG